MKYLLVILLIALVSACEPARVEKGNALWYMYSNEYASCRPYYSKSHSSTDTLLVDMFRPDDNRFGKTCLELKKILGE